MRRFARIDDNQREIVELFRKLGFSVVMLHQVGNGCPDIMLGKHGVNTLVELKDGNKSPSKRKLTDGQKEFHESWQGEVFIVKSKAEAILLAQELDRRAYETRTVH